jgi:hypothetical protein
MQDEHRELNSFRQGQRIVKMMLIIGLALSLFGGTALGQYKPSSSSDLPASVYLIPSSACCAGGTIDITIKVGRVRDLYGVEYKLSFDPEVLNVVEGGVQQPSDDYIFAGREVFEPEMSIDNGAGSVSYAATLTGDSGETGWGALSVITFEVVGQGTSSLQFDTMGGASVLSNSEAQPINTMWYQGLIMAPESCYSLFLPLVVD